MQIAYFNPELQMEVEPGVSWAFKNPVTGTHIAFDCLGSHGAVVLGLQQELRPVPTAKAFEMRFMRLDGKPTMLMGKEGAPPNNSSNDWYDRTGNSHSTGGARRSFVSTGVERHARGLPDGMRSLLTWTADQRSRPVAHPDWSWASKGTYRQLRSGWKYDKQHFGWAVFDPAHIESAPLFSAAFEGSEEALVHLTTLLMWVTNSTYDPSTGRLLRLWRGSDQERAAGWFIWLLSRCALLGIGTGPACQEFRDTFLAGIDPKSLLILALKDWVANPPPVGAGNIDKRCMPLFPASYGFQAAVMYAAGGYVLQTGLVSNKQLAADFRAVLETRYNATRHLLIGPRGMARSHSRDGGKTAADLAAVQAADTAHKYQLSPDGYIQDVPRIEDTELLLGAVAFLFGPDHPDAVALGALMPSTDRQDKFDDVGRYANPWYALKALTLP